MLHKLKKHEKCETGWQLMARTPDGLLRPLYMESYGPKYEDILIKAQGKLDFHVFKYFKDARNEYQRIVKKSSFFKNGKWACRRPNHLGKSPLNPIATWWSTLVLKRVFISGHIKTAITSEGAEIFLASHLYIPSLKSLTSPHPSRTGSLGLYAVHGGQHTSNEKPSPLYQGGAGSLRE